MRSARLARHAAAAAFIGVIASATGLSATSCVFTPNVLNCVGPGDNCCSNNNQYIVSASPQNGVYQPAACHVNFGDGTRECGKGATSPNFDAVYATSCSLDPNVQPYPCQYIDPTQLGEEQFPDLLTCDAASNTCLMDATQVLGDPCTSGNECASGICNGNVCQGLPLDAMCSAGACAVGLYCKIRAGNSTGTCAQSIGAGGACETLPACRRGLLCNLKAANPTCQAMFSQPVGTPVNSPDLCSSGFNDADGACSPAPATSDVGVSCDCGVNPSTAGTVCFCAAGNTCKVRPHTLRTVNMVNARQAARNCFLTAQAPDGTLCSDPWMNLGVGRRISELGTCGWFRCHNEIMAYEAAEGDTLQGPYAQFDHDPACGQAAMQSYYTAAGAGQIGCYLPQALRSAGWACNSEGATNTGLNGGQKFGVACAVLIPLGLVGWAAFALYTGRAPAWLKSGASKVSSGASSAWSSASAAASGMRGGSTYSKVGAASSSSSSASRPLASSSAYTTFGSSSTSASAPAGGSYQ